MRRWTVITIISLCVLIGGLVFIKGRANLQSNLSLVAAAKYFVDDEPFSPDVIAFLLEQSPSSTQKRTTAVLLAIGLQGRSGQAQAEVWLRKAIEQASVEEQYTIAVRLEKQGERSARLGQMEEALVAFDLVRTLDLPFPEPYFWMGQHSYSSLLEIGIPYYEAFQLATAASASTPRDNAFKSMAHTRLCEYFSRTGDIEARNYELAEQHCRKALHLTNYAANSLMTGYPGLAQQLLEQILAK